ncbi:MAG TPA: glycoside hydrolase family 3 N-terminal domain-containing protein [Longimicrobiales bacterium]|nr:glycoside hydrolase family 3 N-terminal domain-containing protein [Longimicrobiales bacterium]
MTSKNAARAFALLGLALLPVMTGFAGPDAVRETHARPGAARAVDGTPEDWVEATLASLDLRGRVAQMVVAWIDGGSPALHSAEYERGRVLVSEQRVGGLIVGKGDALATAAWLNELQRASTVPLLVTADLEWGPGTRLLGATTIPVNMALAATGDLRYVYEAGRITALEARAAGIHMAFAPVADVNVNPRNPVINTRSYGADASIVAAHVSAFIAGARDAGLLTVAKHFPGHGDTEVDSHLEMPVLSASRMRLEEVELVPFRAAVNAGVDGIMTAHLNVPALDPMGARPATLSHAILTDLLRQDLGFGGLIVTDALIMDGVRRRGDNGAVAVEAVLAGADILLMPPSAAEAIDAVVLAVRNGRITAERIDQSVRRILRAKLEAGLDRGAVADTAALARLLAGGAHQRWADAVAARSLTLVRLAHGALPLAPLPDGSPAPLTVVVYDESAQSSRGSTFADALRARGHEVALIRTSRNSTYAQLRAAERSARGVVVFLSFSNAAPWRGRLGLPGPIAAMVDGLAARGALVFNFGNPYLLPQVPHAETYLLAWAEDPVMETAAARALAGEERVAGLLPIWLEGYVLGSGLTLPSLSQNADWRPVSGGTVGY